MAGGEPDVIHRLRALFDAMGTLHHIGPAGTGQLAKLANQTIVGITIGAVAEAFLLAGSGGPISAQCALPCSVDLPVLKSLPSTASG